MFIDLTNVFDTKSSKVLKKFGITDKMLKIIISIYQGIKATVFVRWRIFRFFRRH